MGRNGTEELGPISKALEPLGHYVGFRVYNCGREADGSRIAESTLVGQEKFKRTIRSRKTVVLQDGHEVNEMVTR